jgi:hypothetical protein
VRSGKTMADRTIKKRTFKDTKKARHFENVHIPDFYSMLRNARIEYHMERIETDEEFLRAHGIRPNVEGSAWKFDILKGER